MDALISFWETLPYLGKFYAFIIGTAVLVILIGFISFVARSVHERHHSHDEQLRY